MLFVEADLALVEFADPALHGLEFRLRLLCAGRGFLDALGQFADLRVGRFHPRAHRLNLAGQPRQPFSSVGLRTHRRHVGFLGR